MLWHRLWYADSKLNVWQNKTRILQHILACRHTYGTPDVSYWIESGLYSKYIYRGSWFLREKFRKKEGKMEARSKHYGLSIKTCFVLKIETRINII